MRLTTTILALLLASSAHAQQADRQPTEKPPVKLNVYPNNMWPYHREPIAPWLPRPEPATSDYRMATQPSVPTGK